MFIARKKKVTEEPSQKELRLALRLVVERYWRQAKARPVLTAFALLLPGLGTIFVAYVPPLAIARLLAKLAADPHATTIDLLPSIAFLCAGWFCGEVLWRIANFLLCRLEVYGMEALHIEAMDELLVSMLTITALLIRPLLRARRRLVHVREEASTVLAGHVADSIANAEAVRAFAREKEEARIHKPKAPDEEDDALVGLPVPPRRYPDIVTPLRERARARGTCPRHPYLTFQSFSRT